MRLFNLLSVIVVSIATNAPHIYSQQRLAQGVKATTRVVSQRYCAVDEEIASLGLVLSTTLVNGSNFAFEVTENFYPKLLVTRTLRDSKMGRYEREQHGPETLISDPVDRTPEHRSIRVSPGESFESTVEVFVGVPVVASAIPKDALLPGRHYLQADIQVLVTERNQPVYRRVVSPPVPFHVKENPEIQNCVNSESPSAR